jgi:hypothetical protein
LNLAGVGKTAEIELGTSTDEPSKSEWRARMTIELDDVKLKYVSISEARRMSGLRIVLGAYPIPGPWRRSCKGVSYVKGLKYVATASNRSRGVLRSLVCTLRRRSF